MVEPGCGDLHAGGHLVRRHTARLDDLDVNDLEAGPSVL